MNVLERVLIRTFSCERFLVNVLERVLIIAVSIAAKGVLANKTVYHDAKTKSYVLI